MPCLATLAVFFALGVRCAALPQAHALGLHMATLMWLAGLCWALFACRASGSGARRGTGPGSGPGLRLPGRPWLWLSFGALCAGGACMSHDLGGMQSVAVPVSANPDDTVLDTVVGEIVGPVETLASEARGDTRVRFALRLAGLDTRVEVTADIADVADVGADADAAVAEPGVWPGDIIQVTGWLRRPRGYRVLGGVPMKRLLHSRGADLQMSARQMLVLERDTRALARPWRWAAQAHTRISRVIRQRGGSVAGNALVRAMVTGDRSGLDRELGQRYRDAGVSHVLAVSGLHLAVIVLLVFACTRRAWAAIPGLAMRARPDLVAALTALPAAAGYTLLTGARVSTVRALLVVAVVLVGVMVMRRARLLDALGLAAIAILAYQPFSLFDPGFQLSFVATATLVLVARGRGRREPAEPADRDGPADLADRAGPRDGLADLAGPRDATDPTPDRRDYSVVGRVVWRVAGRVAGRVGRALAELVRVSVWATLATAPLTALSFGQVAFGGLVANLLAVPVTELCIVPLGFLGAAVATVWPGAGGLLLDLVIAVAHVLDRAVAAIAAVSPAVSVFPPNNWELVGALLVWWVAVLGGRGFGDRGGSGVVARLPARLPVRLLVRLLARLPVRLPVRVVVRLVVLGLALALIAGSYTYTIYIEPRARDHVRISFLDVGQGDAAVIELPGGGVWLIDSGGLPYVSQRVRDERERAYLAESPGRLSVARFLAARRIRRIDLLIISHPHPDHYEGVRAVAREVPIDVLWMARDHGNTAPSYQALVRELEAAGTVVRHPALDQKSQTQTRAHGQVSLTVLAPRYLDGRATHDPTVAFNDNSLVIQLRAFGRTVLFAGDIEHEGEALLLEHHHDLRADLVKAPHHGSRTSSTAGFVAATRPRWVVISCAVANRFGHPAAEVLERWSAAGARVLRTDRSGSVTARITPDGGMDVTVFDP